MTTHGHNTMGLLQHANTSTSVADGIYETVCSTVQTLFIRVCSNNLTGKSQLTLIYMLQGADLSENRKHN